MTTETWIQYFPDPDRKEQMPTSGFVEFTDTFFGDTKKYVMDMSQENLEKSLMWNRSAPRCVAKYRFIPEKEFLEAKAHYFDTLIKKLDEDRKKYMDEFNKCVDRIKQI